MTPHEIAIKKARKAYQRSLKDGAGSLEATCKAYHASMMEQLFSESVGEEVAKLEHDQWMEWAKTLMTEERISSERKDRWVACMKPYHQLSGEMKEHDRKWAHKVLARIAQIMGG